MPEAIVETISLGTPTGSTRIPAAAITVPPEPPAAIAPAIAPAMPPPWRRTQVSNACAMAATDAPRSPVNTPAAPRGWNAAMRCGGTSAPDGTPLVERSTRRVRSPASRRMSRMNRSSAPFVSSVPTTSTAGSPPAGSERASGRAAPWSAARDSRLATVRAAAMMDATGAGCDQRVGGAGLAR